jgi:predicted P-loop ATPase
MQNISIYKRGSDTKSQEQIPIDIFLERIKDGFYQDIVLPIRAMANDPDAQDQAKKKAPNVTLSGAFRERKDSEIIDHSGYIGIDVDSLNSEVNHYKSLLACDPHIYSIFTSIRGNGLCCIFKIDGKRHREAFAGIGEYLLEKYQIVIDPTSVNVSRARFVSYDPDIWINHKPVKFTQYPKKKEPKTYPKIIYVKSDFEKIIQQIQDRGVNICDSYHEWLRCAFALSEHFGEGGRGYFHTISQNSSKYDSNICDKQYNHCLRASGSRKTTIATLYYYAKQAGVQTYSTETKEIATIASQGKKSGLDPKQVKENIRKFSDSPINDNDLESILDQVEHGTEIAKDDEESLVPQLEAFLQLNYEFKRNEITRYIEIKLNNEFLPMERKHFNSVYIKAKRQIPKLSFELLERIIDSEFTNEYNPIKEWFEKHPCTTEDNIEKLFACIQTDNIELAYLLGRKWLVSIVASVYGQHSPLMYCLAGEKQNTGKTEFFRRLLPNELKKYYAESKLDAGKDDDILMTQKIIIMDDEMGGKSKTDERRLKELLSKQVFSLREPYGKGNVDLQRLAVLCGTSNEKRLISDATGNRRLIPVYVESIRHKEYNAIDKNDLFAEAYKLYKDGFDFRLTKDDIAMLEGSTDQFQFFSLEYELINKYFEKVEMETYGAYMTATDIKVFLEKNTQQKLTLDKIGKEMTRLGYIKKTKRVDGHPKMVYLLKIVVSGENTQNVDNQPFN